jgi:hypothetical protein
VSTVSLGCCDARIMLDQTLQEADEQLEGGSTIGLIGAYSVCATSYLLLWLEIYNAITLDFVTGQSLSWRGQFPNESRFPAAAASAEVDDHVEVM